MQVQLFDKEGQVTSSSVYFAYKILKVFKSRRVERLSFFKLFKCFKDMNPNADPKQMFYALMFLKMAGVIRIDDIYVTIEAPNA